MRYVIIGGSAAATAAAKTIRSLDGDGVITMITQDHRLYSRCQLHLVASGASTVERITLSTPQLWERLRVRLLTGVTVAGLAPQLRRVFLDSGASIPYDRLLVATGSRSAAPPLSGLPGPLSFGLRDLDDALAIRDALPKAEHVTVIGAGLVGVELAAEFAKSGKHVSMVEFSSRPLPLQLDEECGGKCAKLLAAAGVELHFLDPAAAVERGPDGKPRSLRLASGIVVPTSLLVCAAGVRPNAEFAAAAGAKVGRGIAIDDRCQTSLPDVFAAGDVTEHEDSVSGKVQTTAIWPTAVRQGKIAGANMAGGDLRLNINTGLKAAVKVLGVHCVSLGPVSSPQPRWDKLVIRRSDSQGRESLKVLYTEGGLLRAALLWGDVSNAGLYHEAIVTHRDIGPDAACLGDLDAAKRGGAKLAVL